MHDLLVFRFLERSSGVVEVICPHTEKMAVLRQIAGLGAAIADVDIRPPRLDEIYAHVMAAGIPAMDEDAQQ